MCFCYPPLSLSFEFTYLVKAVATKLPAPLLPLMIPPFPAPLLPLLLLPRLLLASDASAIVVSAVLTVVLLSCDIESPQLPLLVEFKSSDTQSKAGTSHQAGGQYEAPINRCTYSGGALFGRSLWYESRKVTCECKDECAKRGR